MLYCVVLIVVSLLCRYHTEVKMMSKNQKLAIVIKSFEISCKQSDQKLHFVTNTSTISKYKE